MQRVFHNDLNTHFDNSISTVLTLAATAFCRAKCWLPVSSPSSWVVMNTWECEALRTPSAAAIVSRVVAVLDSRRSSTKVAWWGRQRRTFWLDFRGKKNIKAFLEMTKLPWLDYTLWSWCRKHFAKTMMSDCNDDDGVFFKNGDADKREDISDFHWWWWVSYIIFVDNIMTMMNHVRRASIIIISMIC